MDSAPCPFTPRLTGEGGRVCRRANAAILGPVGYVQRPRWHDVWYSPGTVNSGLSPDTGPIDRSRTAEDPSQ